MQKKIESFFKHSSSSQNCNFDDLFDGIGERKQSEIRIKYTRQSFREGESTSEGLTGEGNFDDSEKIEKLKDVGGKGKILNKKRSYAQFHLELGQSDFLLHTCKLCGIKYAKGDETDEKVHTTLHKNFTHGIPFKGWRQERVIDLRSLERDRIILVLSSDPPAQRKKVQEVLKVMEIELGDGWIFHELCKVYLYITSQRVGGCMIVEPIKAAHKVLSHSVEISSNGSHEKEIISKPKTLQFGGICFQREISKKGSNHKSLKTMDSSLVGSIVCVEEATPASCGVRAIWVSPSNRRKHIATHLLDAVRKSFSTEYFLEHTQLAFSQPTSAGKALATKYTGTGSFLVYKN